MFCIFSSTSVYVELWMRGPPLSRRPPGFFGHKHMLISRKTTIRLRKGLLTGAMNNTHLFLGFETSRVFITRKIGVPAQGWKTPRTYYASAGGKYSKRKPTWESTESSSHLGVPWDSFLCCPAEQRWLTGGANVLYPRSCPGGSCPGTTEPLV